MTAIADRPNTWPWPPIVYSLAIVVGVFLGWVVPIAWFSGAIGHSLEWLGIGMIGVGLALDIAALLALRRHRTTVLPNKGSDALVTDGPFAFSRNPIYLGNTVLISGIAVWLGEPWLLVTAIVAALAVQKLAIEREEAHLASRFGDVWTAYSKSVRRWF